MGKRHLVPPSNQQSAISNQQSMGSEPLMLVLATTVDLWTAGN